MAATGQNITIHELDKFSVRFTFTDAVGAINGATPEGWWGVAAAVNTSYASWKMQKSTDGWTQGAAANAVANHGGMTIGTSTIDIEAKLAMGSTTTLPAETGSVNIPAGTYYHECVFTPTGGQQGSTVVATGTLTCLESLFTKFEYRK
tara:strand:+ start:121 stop:564 length:444 start_codon:yes stop_codon:yes gene_type:complete